MMRTRALLFALALLPSLAAVAQKETTAAAPTMFQKGRFYVSAAASWKREDYDLKDRKQWNLEPMVGYFIVDRVAIGVGGVIGLYDFHYLQENLAVGTTTYKDQETTWGALGPTVRGYLGGPSIGAFGQLGGYFGSIEQTNENNFTTTGEPVDQLTEGSFQAYDFGAGLAWYFKQTVGIELTAHYYLLYSQTTTNITYADGSQTRYDRTKNNGDGGGASLGLVFHFGLQKGRTKPAN